MLLNVEKAMRLTDKYIEQNPHRAGLGEARVIGTGIPVWALVAYSRAAKGDLERVAADYDLPLDAVKAAIEYYRENRSIIDARIAANAAA